MNSKTKEMSETSSVYEPEAEYCYKIILLGDSGVGKTNILNRLTKNQFDHSSKATVGVEFYIKHIEVEDQKLKFQIWDTAGQERYRCITKTYCQGAVAVIIVYDITNKESFVNVAGWLKEIRGCCD